MRPRLRRAGVSLLCVSFLGLAGCGSSGVDDDVALVAFLRALPAQDQDPLTNELRSGGYIAGDNLAAVQDDPLGEVHTDPDSARAAVTDWVEAGVDLIFAFSSSGAAAAAEVTSDVPILFLVNDPTAVGLVDDETQPERNLTGVTFRVPADRTVDLVRRAVPGTEHIGVLSPKADPAGPPARDAIVDAIDAAGLTSTTEAFSDEGDIERAVAALIGADIDALALVNTPTSVRFAGIIEPLATAAGIPIVANTTFVQGATLVLEPDVDELLAQLGRQAVRILDGASPSSIPVEDPRQFRIVLDAGMAADLGLPEFSPDLIRQADEVVP